MEPLFKNERIRGLLRQADDATRLLERLGDGPETHEIREALTGILRDLGREVHVAWRGLQASGDAPPAEPVITADDLDSRQTEEVSQEKTAESLEVDAHTDIPEHPPEPPQDAEDLERWYTDEVEIKREEPLFDPGELDEGTDAGGIGRARDADDDVPFVGLEGFEVAHGEGQMWVASLREFVTLVGEPPVDGADLAEEASKVQWATTGLDARWAEWPPSARTALLGLLGSRARNLQAKLEVDLGPRMALDRLRKQRRASDLPSVAALAPERQPETGAWSADARGWWAAVAKGLDGNPTGG